MWICPECGRKFARNKQSHSCIEYNIEDHFFGKSENARSLHNAVIGSIGHFGEMEVHSAKWSINVRRLSTFLSVMIEKSHLTLVFVSEEPIDEFPVHQNYQHTGNRFSNTVKIESLDEIDDQLIRWLKRAWEISG